MNYCYYNNNLISNKAQKMDILLEEEYNKVKHNSELDIFEILHDKSCYNKNNRYVLKLHNEYGVNIQSYNMINTYPHYEKHGLDIFVNFCNNNYSSYPFYISSYSYYKNGTIIDNNLIEQIYSNRTEYFVNGKYVSTDENYVEHIIKHINDKLLNDKVYSWLVDFISNKKNIIIVDKIEKNEIENFPH